MKNIKHIITTSKEYQVEVMRDPEGNGGGHLNIVNLGENKND